MKPSNHQRFPHRSTVQDAFILLTPIILSFVAVLWFLSEPPARAAFTNLLVSFIDSFLALVTRAA